MRLLKSEEEYAVYYLPTDFQSPELFVPRKPLSDQAKRAGWQGFLYDLSKVPQGAFIRIV
ncbi:DpnI domain-containing protein [Acinetobacter thermotolerans]|uniref:DpnI domain-containing protein n=1 Tax=Acinetobacter thermotolerans TaxID=3151487 RepID=UPI0038514988